MDDAFAEPVRVAAVSVVEPGANGGEGAGCEFMAEGGERVAEVVVVADDGRARDGLEGSGGAVVGPTRRGRFEDVEGEGDALEGSAECLRAE